MRNTRASDILDEVSEWIGQAAIILWRLGVRSVVDGEIVAWRPDAESKLLNPALTTVTPMPPPLLEGPGGSGAVSGCTGGRCACNRHVVLAAAEDPGTGATRSTVIDLDDIELEDVDPDGGSIGDDD